MDLRIFNLLVPFYGPKEHAMEGAFDGIESYLFNKTTILRTKLWGRGVAGEREKVF